MIDHIGLHVRDVARATEFYLEALSPLGYGIVMQVSAEERGSQGGAVGFGAGQKPSFWIAEGEPKSGPMHVAFVAPSGSGRCLLSSGDEGRRQRQWSARA